MKNIKRVAATGLSAVAISVLIGGGAASACSMSNADGGEYSEHNSGTAQTTGYHEHMGMGGDQQAQDEWHAKLDAALREHAAVGVAALKAEALKEPDVAALTNVVNQNSLMISELVDQGYPGVHDEFLELWQSHIGYYKEYLVAAQAKDEAGKQQAKDKLAMFTNELSELLANNSNDELDEAALQESLAMHGNQVTTIMDYFVDGTYDGAWMTAHEAYEHMGMVANMLAGGAQHEDNDYMRL